MDVLTQYIDINRCLRSILNKTYDAISAIEYEGSGYAIPIIRYIKADLKLLRRLWPVPDSLPLGELETAFEKEVNSEFKLRDLGIVIDSLIPNLADELDDLFMSLGTRTEAYGLEGLLHPIIIRSSYRQYREGLYRDAVFNAIVAVFDRIRELTGLNEDGVQLIGKVFSLDNPVLVLSTIETESGKDEQKGFIQILQGAYLGIRNPKAHSLTTDLKQDTAAQYLVFASLLARRIEEARFVKQNTA